MGASEAVGFGTSGLRGPAEGFSPGLVNAYVAAFLATVCTGAAGKTLVIGADLRASSPAIAALVARAARGQGWEPVFAGNVPTPALAAYALERGVPAVMVTGSHIPPRYNGLKFYRPDGELLKSDEAPIRAAAAPLLAAGASLPEAGLPPLEAAVADGYRARFTGCFEATALDGLRLGVFVHSAVGRDLLVAVLEALGASCHVFGRQEAFVAVDTEAVGADHMAAMRDALDRRGLDAVVSTDGDGDRPLLLDEAGNQVNGDVLGALTARMLGARTVVTPLTSTGGIERSGWFPTVRRTRIGSPYVVEAMAGAGDRVVGFEANGGFLVGTSFDLAAGRLARLPTRDAMLPLVAVLAESVRRGVPVSELAAALPPRVMKADRLKEIAPERGNAFVAAMAGSAAQRSGFDSRLADPAEIDTTDGTRLALRDGTIVHFRQSGNAPELRCYVETGSAGETDTLLDAMMTRLAQHFERQDA